MYQFLGTSMGSTAASRGRQAFAMVTNRQDAVVGGTADLGGTEGSKDGNVEFSKEELEALLNEKIKGKRFDLKGKMQLMNENINKLKLCIKWFQNVEEGHIQELEKLRSSLEYVESRFTDAEVVMKNKEEGFNKIIVELKMNNSSLHEKPTEEELMKLDAINCHKREKEVRDALEKLQASLSEELRKAQQEISGANQKFTSVNADHNRLQEYNKSLQHYNRQLQTDVATVNESIKRVEKEKAAIVENISTLRGHYNLLLEQLSSSRECLLLSKLQ